MSVTQSQNKKLQVNLIGGFALTELSSDEKEFVVLSLVNSGFPNEKEISLPFTKGTNPKFKRPIVFTVDGNNLGQSLDMKILRVEQDQEAEIITQVEVPIRNMLAHAPSYVSQSLQLFQSPLWKDNRDFCISYTFVQNAVMPGNQLAHVSGRAQGIELMPGLGGGLMLGQGAGQMLNQGGGSGQMQGQGGGLISDNASIWSQGNTQMVGWPMELEGHQLEQCHGRRYQPQYQVPGYQPQYQVPGYQTQHEENHPLIQPGPRPRPRRNWFRSIRRELSAWVAEIGVFFCGNVLVNVADDEDGIEA